MCMPCSLHCIMQRSCTVALEPRSEQFTTMLSRCANRRSDKQNLKYLKAAALIRMQCQPFSLLRGDGLLAAVVRSPR